MANQTGAPDSWESIDNSENDAGVAKSLSGLNVGAKPFVPNVNAAVFVPSFAKAPPQSAPGKLYFIYFNSVTLFLFSIISDLTA